MNGLEKVWFLLTGRRICRGNTLDSHRLIYLAGQQGLDKQHDLVEELCLGYFTQGKFIGDRYVLRILLIYVGCW